MADGNDNKLNSQKKEKRHIWYVCMLIGFVALVVFASMGYIFYLGNHMVAVHTPMIDAAMEIKIQSTNGYLLLEELISQDRNTGIDEVLEFIDRADWYAKVMLDGGQSAEGKFIPFQDPRMRQAITEVRRGISKLREITIQRWQSKNISGIGTEIDRKYHEVFNDFVQQADLVEADIKRLIARGLKNFQIVQIVLIAICFIVTFIVGISFSRFLGKQIRHEHELQAANQQLEASNQQLMASEPQLKAANQQLTASEHETRILARFPSENPHPVLRISKDKSVLYCNKAGRIILDAWGCNENQCLCFPEEEKKLMEEALSSGKVITFDLVHGGRTFSLTLAPFTELEYVNVYANDITERKRAEDERLADVHFLEKTAQIDRIILVADELKQMMGDVLKAVLSMFDCDRAFLLHPCDPESDSWCVPMECTRPEYPGAFVLGTDLPMTPELAKSFRAVLASNGPIVMTWPPGGCNWDPENRFGVLSQLAMAIYPRKGKPWAFGIHQCSGSRIWTEQEQTLFGAIGRRLSDGLSSLLLLRDLQESESKLREAQQMAHLGHWWWDVKTGEVEWSDEVYGIFRLDPQKFTPQIDSILELSPWPEDHQRDRELIQRAIESREQGSYEQRLLYPDGSTGYYFSTFQGIYDSSDDLIAMKGTVQDITERKKVQEAVRQERDKAQKYLDVAGVMIVVIDADQKVKLINQKGCNILGYNEQDIINKNWFDNFLPENLRKEVKDVFDKIIIGEIELFEYFENPVLTKNGEEKIIAWHNTVLRNEQGRIIGTLSSGEDITNRKRAEEELFDYQVKLKSLASKLSVIEERERYRLATELHDQIGQSLVMSKLKLDSLRESISSDTPVGILDDVRDCLKQVIQDTRTLTYDLSYPILYELGFEVAVSEWLNGQIREKYNIETEFQDDGKVKPLDDDIRAILFRNVRELLVNVVKHANAQKVEVSVSKDDEDICVVVKDDGVGFEPSEVVSNSGFGIFSIRERLEQLDGSFKIESKPGLGSRFTMKAPLKFNKCSEGVEK